MEKPDQTPPPTIGDTIKSAFALAHDAEALRDVLAAQLPRATGRSHSIGHRAYTALTDLVVGFRNLEDQIAEPAPPSVATPSTSTTNARAMRSSHLL